MPRTQKNNVAKKDEPTSKSSKLQNSKSEQDSVISSNVPTSSTRVSTKLSGNNIPNIPSSSNNNVSTTSVLVSSGSQHQQSSSIVSTPVTTSASTTTIQTLQAEGLPFQTEEGGLVGILVTPVGSNVELGNLVQGHDGAIVMLTTTQGVTGSPTAAALSALQGVNFSVLQTNSTTGNNNGANNNGAQGSAPNLDSTSGIITINNGNRSGLGSGTATVSRIANVIQHHQSSGNTNSSNSAGSNNNSSVISTTGKL